MKNNRYLVAVIAGLGLVFSLKPLKTAAAEPSWAANVISFVQDELAQGDLDNDFGTIPAKKLKGAAAEAYQAAKSRGEKVVAYDVDDNADPAAIVILVGSQERPSAILVFDKNGDAPSGDQAAGCQPTSFGSTPEAVQWFRQHYEGIHAVNEVDNTIVLEFGTPAQKEAAESGVCPLNYSQPIELRGGGQLYVTAGIYGNHD